MRVGFIKGSIVPLDKIQVLQRLPGGHNSIDKQEAISSSGSFLNHMRYEDTQASNRKKEQKLGSQVIKVRNPFSETVTESYSYKIKQKDVQQEYWLVVHSYMTSDKPGCSTSNFKPYIEQVKSITENRRFVGEFYRQRRCRDHPGFVYGLLDVPEVYELCVVGKLNPPEKYRRGLNKFDINV
ncbi:hypothetical protein ILUMI_27273 [Ignelater luminosus]|uniref:Uncharacterized protein n=1 Tax=Ignelater luminosus TaxID=2038154 RepID=A0A8K0FXW4_IGNLU|nr:hypothetical protein ILUMI_27273 [Ignelater luminosus]